MLSRGNPYPLKRPAVPCAVSFVSKLNGCSQPSIVMSTGGGGLKVYAEERWESGLGAGEREYLSELMKDWRGARGERAAAILDELAELSVGPLRRVEAGVADAAQLARLMEPFR